MRRWLALALISVFALSLAACDNDSPAKKKLDGSTVDSSTRLDSGVVDQAIVDTALPDTAVTDGATGDGVTTDGATGDGTIEPDAGPVFGCSSVTPPAGNNGAAVELTLFGLLFETGATVELTDLVDGTVIDLGAATVSDTDSDQLNDRAVVTVPAATAQGLYEVAIVNPSTDRASCGTYLSTTEQPPTVTDVQPDTAWEGSSADDVLSDQPVSVGGTGFRAVPVVRFVRLVSGVETDTVFEATSMSYINETSLSSLCPSESQQMPVGEYHVYVVNPSGLAGLWMVGDEPGIFRVTNTPPPRIDTVEPFKVPANAGSGGTAAVEITITGDNFDANSEVVLLLPGDQELDLTAEITDYNIDPSGPDTITFNLGPAGTTPTLAVGIYPLRVINAEGQFDTFFSIQVENVSPGRLNADDWTDVSDLVVPRERHESSNGFDVFGNSYLYVVGGTSLPEGGDLDTRPRPVMRSCEVVQVDIFGVTQPQGRLLEQLDPALDLSSFDPRSGTLRSLNLLDVPRTGLAMTRVGAHLYAIGGANTDTWDPASVEPGNGGPVDALATMEHARILGYETMPNLSLPRVESTPRGLPRGSWYYRVSAASAGVGESLASREVVARNAGGRITLTWQAVSGATSYLIYRSPAADGRSGTARLLATGVTATTFVDDGQGALTPAPGRLRGKLATGTALAVGEWTYRVTAVVDGEETIAGYSTTLTTESGSQNIELAWDPIPDATYNLYRSSAAGESQTFLLVSGLTDPSYTDDNSGTLDTDTPAPDGIAPLPAGSLSRWQELTPQLNTAREGAEAISVVAVDDDPNTDNKTYIFVVGGRETNAFDTEHLKTTERLEVDPATGAPVGGWEVMKDGSNADIVLNHARAFFGLVKTQGRNVVPVAPPPPPPPCPDDDGDGYTNCACGGDDCDDTRATVYPGATEICGDGIDQDCDQGCDPGNDEACTTDPCVDRDRDNDGFDRPECGGADCNDNDPTICPDPVKCPDICGDGVDQDCSGGDAVCDCTDPDGDNDGFDRPECGGNDCDDDDPTICPDRDQCPDINCDGIDQDCDGVPRCIILSTPLPPLGRQPRLAPLPTRIEATSLTPVSTPYFPPSLMLTAGEIEDEPVYLVAVLGDDSFAATGNTPLAEEFGAEVALVNKDGTLTGWTLQAEQAQKAVYGNDALLIGEFIFSFNGVMVETIGTDPAGTAIWNNAQTYTVDETAITDWVATVPDDVLIDHDPTDATDNASRRCYLSAERVNGFIFGIGGNLGAGEGPTDLITRIKQ